MTGRSAARIALLGFIPLLGILLLWQVLGSVAPNPLLPPPTAWVEAIQNIGARALFIAVGATLLTFVTGIVLATILGVIGGVLIGASPRVERALNLLLEFLRALPAPVIIPIAVLAWGSGLATSLVAVVFASAWPVLMNTLQAVHARPTLYSSVARTLQLTTAQEVRQFLLPSAVPGIVVGFRVAVPIALVVTILVEMLTAIPGVGNLLLNAQRAYESGQAFGLLVVAGLIGYALTILAQAVASRILSRWPPEAR